MDEFIKQRRFPRRKFTNKVGILSKGIYKIAICKEIGEGGLGLFSPHYFSEKNTILLSFQIKKLEFIIVFARICNFSKQNENYIYGIEFQNLNFKYNKIIRNYVAEKREVNEKE